MTFISQTNDVICSISNHRLSNVVKADIFQCDAAAKDDVIFKWRHKCSNLKAVADVDLGWAGHAGELVGREVGDDFAVTGPVSGERHGVRDALAWTNGFPFGMERKEMYDKWYIYRIITHSL